MNLNALRNRLDKAEDEVKRLQGEAPNPDAERVRLQLEAKATRAALHIYEKMAAKPFAERARGCSPPESAERIFGDAAMAAHVDSLRRRLACLQRRLEQLIEAAKAAA